MEDAQLERMGSARRSRPESISSATTRITPMSTKSSSNGSTQHVPSRTGRSTPGANLLQERLRERKVEAAKANSNSDRGGVQSSPVKAPKEREERRPSSSGMGGPKGMGVKQMEDQVSTLHKQNFDLKLELYHRRQRQESLEARLEAAEKQLDEQSEMQEVNEQLLAELERRDQALDEAVGVIVTLEEKVDRLMKEREMVRSVDAHYDPSYTKSEEFSSSPPTMPDRNVVRMPSFLSERSEGTQALRSLYLPHNHNFSDSTLPKLHEEGSVDEMDSPRLSVLSESSFLSVYGEKHLKLDTEPEERGHKKASSIEKWIAERPLVTATPQKSSPEILRRKQFLSINDVLESPLQKLEKLKHTLEKHQLPERTNPSKDREKRKSREISRRGFTDKASFEHQQTLPPTPDTISTSTLRHFGNSKDPIASEETSFLSTTSTFTPGLTYNTYESALSVRPRSAGETITSRREGHGWDTETQEDLTETGSVGSTTSAYSASYTRRPHRIVTPELFNFSTSVNNREQDWGRDMMFNQNQRSSRLPTNHNSTIRRSSMVERPESDNTIIPYNRNTPSRYTELRRGSSPIDTSPRPDLPDRRSSLSAVAKSRKSVTQPQQSSPSKTPSQAQTQIGTTNIPSSNNTTPTTSRTSRITSRLFRRGNEDSSHQQQETPPQPPAHNTSTRVRNTTNTTTALSSRKDTNIPSIFETRDLQCATPPPIRRSRTAATSNQISGTIRHIPTSTSARNGNRPSSAGTGAAVDLRNARNQRDTFGYDGVFDDGDDDDVGYENENELPSNGRKTRKKRGSVDFTGLSAVGGGGIAGLAGGIGSGSFGGTGTGGEEEKTLGRKWFGGLRRG